MKQNIKAVISYDGTHYFGWQDNKDRPSIEGELRSCLERILQHEVKLQAASRTDAGVHARGQVVNFFVDPSRTDGSKLLPSLNSLLPKDIRVLELAPCDSDFHPTLSSIAKEYHYEICFSPIQDPRHRHFSWHVPRSLNLDLMEEAIPHLIGRRDFRAFCNFRRDLNYTSYERFLESIFLVPTDSQRLRIQVKGSSFLYKMVRNLVGTLVYIGQGKIHATEIPQILDGGQRALAGVTAPAHGLCLLHIFY